MRLFKKKWFRRIKGMFGFVLAAFVIMTICGITAYAETAAMPTMPDMSDMIPDGTNIPDSDIGGAVGSDSPFSSSADSSMNGDSDITSETATDTEFGKIPSTNIDGESGTSVLGDNPDTSDSLGRVLGIVIAVIVVLAVIMLIIALVPRRPGEAMSGDGKGNRFDSNKKK